MNLKNKFYFDNIGTLIGDDIEEYKILMKSLKLVDLFQLKMKLKEI